MEYLTQIYEYSILNRTGIRQFAESLSDREGVKI